MDVGTGTLRGTERLCCLLNDPRPSKFLSKEERGKQRDFLLSAEHFCEYAADAPEVHGGGVAGLQQDFGGPVPQRDDLQRQMGRALRRETAVCFDSSSRVAECQDSVPKDQMGTLR